ncbi:sulfotransferase domain-containing protein [Rhizorhabdus sp.]|uniref:sulfotransferase domain-containing protein n=1 Tax=Rhizorhabdus sp. TaxID=1968843 RepID=UPI0019BA81A2|nr:sulfotransferase domain-containing protein [Rhizorhabdus sp.]MBD3759544.1 sulfotransferase [Rhizorhabdus sp.]
MNEDPRLGFLVAGVQKGGTSALFEYLRELPGLQLPAVKEAHFFDDETIDWAAPDYHAYHGLFADDERLRGEATPIYIYWPNSLERIARYNPKMKIILLFRDPIERAWSHWKMEYAKRKETHPFAWCIREGRARLMDGDRSAPGHHRVFSYVERGFYGQQVERLFQLFPREQCILLRSEELNAAPSRAVGQICRFLGLPSPGDIRPRTVHAARAAAYPSRLEERDRALLSSLYRPDLARFEKLTGWNTSFWTRNWP